jgi:hypothetical protein
MGLKPRYKPDNKQSVIAALQVMIDNLYTNLQITDKITFDLDTVEEHRKTFEMCDETPPPAEELRQSVEEAKDRSIRELGHIQKRIDEVRALKDAFESSEIPSPAVLGKTYRALRSSLTLEAMQLCIGNPREEIFASGIAGLNLGKEKAEEVDRLGKTLQAYTEALMFSFNLSMIFWNEFPFDDA